MTHSHSNKAPLVQSGVFRSALALVIVGLVVVVGYFVIFKSQAAGLFGTAEVESGQTAAPAVVVNDANASGGKMVRFGASAVGNLTLQAFATGLTAPTSATNSGVAGDTRMFALERAGKVRIIQAGGALSPTPFLDISSKTTYTNSNGDERGLVGITFHPNYASNRQFYVFYTDLSGTVTVSRFLRSEGDTNVADPASEQKIITVPHPTNFNHNGGGLTFGPDGYLYISFGDGGGSGNPSNSAQDKNSLLGKIVRIDINNGNPYAVPANNPFVDQILVRPEIWALGLRNPWRVSFDGSGNMFIADVGQDAWEEVDYHEAGTAAGQNFGWRCYEGNHGYNTLACPAQSSFAAPIYEYDHSGGRCSITGGYIYRGAQYPGLQGQYIFADFCAGTISRITKNGNSWALAGTNTFAGNRISSFGEDINHELYAVNLANGTIYKVIATP